MRLIHVLLLVAVGLCLTDCSEQVLFHEFKHLQNEEWNRADTLEYLLPDSTAAGEYDFSVSLRLTPRFPFRELWIAVDTELSNPMQRLRDTIRIGFEKEKMNLFVNGVNLSQVDCPVGKIKLENGQSGKVRLFHLMSRETLPCIHDVGVWLKH